MTPTTYPIVNHPSAWVAADYAGHPEKWIRVLPEAVRREIEAAAARIPRNSVEEIAATDVDGTGLDAARKYLAGIEEEVMKGRGFVLLRGLSADIDDWTLRAAYWVIVSLMGRMISQNSYGERLCDVSDTGAEPGGRRVRGYQTSASLHFHTDRCDLVGLLCLRPAMEGGRSSIASAVTIYNELVKHNPGMLPPLFNGMNYLNLEVGGDSSVVRLPVFDFQGDTLSVRYARNSYHTAIRHGADYTELEKAALDAVDALANDPAMRLDMDLQRGDMQLINNYTTLHSRTAFTDWPDAGRKRCMTRAWVETHLPRAVGPHFSDYHGVPVLMSRETGTATS